MSSVSASENSPRNLPYFIFQKNDAWYDLICKYILLVFQGYREMEEYFPYLSERNIQSLTFEQMKKVSADKIRLAASTVLEVLNPIYVRNLSKAQKGAYFEVCGFGNLDRYSSIFQKRLINGELCEILPKHIATFTQKTLSLLKSEAFESLSAECLEAFHPKLRMHFTDSQKINFVQAYFNTHPTEIDFQKFEPEILGSDVINIISLTPERIKAFTDNHYKELLPTTIMRMDLGCIECIDHDVIKKVFDEDQRGVYFEIFDTLNRQKYRKAWQNDLDWQTQWSLPDVMMKSFEKYCSNNKPSKIYDLECFEESEYQIGFINGVWNPEEGAKSSAQYLSRMANGYNVHGVYNATHGKIADLLECRQGLMYNATEPVGELHKMWNAFFEKNKGNSAQFLMICHSQGAIHVRNALLNYDKALRKRIRVVAIAPGAYIYPETCAKVEHCRVKALRDPVPAIDSKGLERCKKRVTYLESHPNAGIIDHRFRSPTYYSKLREHIEDYLPKSLRDKAFSEKLNKEWSIIGLVEKVSA
ncbi:MAG: DUF687 family protein [Chlamydiales bacterium]|nr:DUF687 family protein [Chlamydiales bacterium]